MKILITGGHGQLGHDVSSLLSQEHTVVSCGSKELDICNQEAVTAAIRAHQPQVLINCAGYTAVDNCEKEKELAWQVNARGPENLAKGMEERGGRLIHISTDYVFAGTKLVPEGYTEEDTAAPLSEYGRSKLGGEQAVAEFSSDHLILRTAWLYGWTGTNFLKTMLRLALADPYRELKVVNDQYGALTWSATLARQIQTVLTSSLQGIAHATAGGSSTWYQGACYFLDAMEIPHNLVPCSTAEYPTPAHRPRNSILDNRRLKERGLSVFTSWQQDIDTFVRLYRKELLQEAAG
ncbi:MAG: dTDP-4-dehydrorhamnose reductase [Proteobacteria bacterium]|nr:dTDP-4-dehydrorhamnose reductase [Pseudomonadota bacterium]MBU1060264.1 dTDP-4-dehydrorhamnose reductase [Pseudomonadota bacterium]